jgi:hypothetical protein
MAEIIKMLNLLCVKICGEAKVILRGKFKAFSILIINKKNGKQMSSIQGAKKKHQKSHSRQ